MAKAIETDDGSRAAQDGGQETGAVPADLIASVVNLSPDILYVYDLVSRTNVYTNNGIEKVLGYSAEEIKALGDTLISSLMHPEDLPGYLDSIVARYAQALDGESIRHQYRMRHRNGGWRWLESNESIYRRLPDGRPQQIVGVIRDVTEQRAAQAALELSERLLNQSQRVARIGHYVLDVSTGRWSSSAVLDDLFGIPSDYDKSIPGWLAILHPDHREAIHDVLVRNTLESRQAFDQEYMIRTIDTGETRWMHGLGTLECAPDGKVLRLFGTVQDITRRKRDEMRIRKGEEEFRHITSQLNIGVFMSRLSGEFVYVNQTVVRIAGYDSPEEVMRLSSPQLYTIPSEREELIHKLRTEGEVQNLLVHCRRKDGTVCRIHINATIQMNESGHPQHIVGTVEDVTERSLAQEALAASERRLNQIFESSGTANAMFDTHFRLVLQNSLSKRHLGVRGDEAYGHDVLAVFGPDRGPTVKARMESVLSTGVPETYETEFTLATGTRWFRSIYQPIADDNGVLSGVQVISQDISESKNAQLQLAEEKERLAVTLRSIGDGVIATGKDGRIQIINAAAEAMTGWSQRDATGRPLQEVYRTLNETTREPGPSPVEQVLAHESRILLADAATLVARDGCQRTIASSGAPILDQAGKILGVVLVFSDITERQQLLETVNRQQKLESIGILAGGIAHDFNNLLGGIFGYLDLALGQARDPEVRDLLQTALSPMNRARSLTRQLLTFAKGGAPITKVEALFPFVRDAVNFALSGAQVSTHFEVAPDLAQSEFDRNQLGQVIDNLVINAVQAMPAGGQLRISAENVTLAEGDIQAVKPGAYVRLSFADSGIGIPHELQPKIFDPFFTTKQKGSGLGLATSHSIVRRHEGVMLVQSEPGKGSTFTVLLPAVKGEAPAVPARAKEISRGSGDALIMDDEESIRSTTGAMLSRLGYTWHGARDGQEAIDLVETFWRQGRSLQFAILDLTVPGGKGGLEAAREIHAINPALPLFVASGYAEDPVIAEPGKYGFLDSLRKPFTTAELGALLSRHRQDG